MKGICPNCEEERELDLVRRKEDIEVRGETIQIPVEYFRCLTCGDEFDDPGSKDDPLDKAYREYRRRRGMVQPEEVRELRKRHGLTQHELARILGWGLATLSRYENGALQSEAHDKTLRFAMEPHNLIKFIKETPDALREEKCKDLIAKLKACENASYSLERFYEEHFGSYGADVFSGYRTLNLQKLFSVILFFCMEGLLKTVLNKVLFYSDFRYFKEHSVSVTGVRYARIPFGPAPDKWQHLFTLLNEEGALNSEEVFYDETVSGEKVTSARNPDLILFDNSEVLVMASIKEHFKGWSAKRISDFSHNEKGYLETPTGHLISYAYAEDLQI